jgi:hypothetical protein
MLILMTQAGKSSRTASILGVLGFLLSVISLGWQMHVHNESLTERALIRLSASFRPDEEHVVSATPIGKHLELTTEVRATKGELAAEIVNFGEHPLFIKRVRLIVPCPEATGSESYLFEPTGGSKPGTPLEPGAAVIYSVRNWNFLDHWLDQGDPPEPFCVTVESNKGFITQSTAITSISVERKVKK